MARDGNLIIGYIAYIYGDFDFGCHFFLILELLRSISIFTLVLP